MVVCLEGGAAGLSYLLLNDNQGEAYTKLKPGDFIGKDPAGYALEFGAGDPIKEMISLAAINAIYQQVMRVTKSEVDSTTDSLGLLSVSNNSLDEILSHCSPDALISVVGPTAGYFPDPLFARGVDVIGGRVVKNGDMLIQRLEQRKR